jgi:hypothetical protein
MLILLNASQAQFTENFDQNITSLQGNCWTMSGINYTTTAGDVINGTGSAYTNPPTNTSGQRNIATPFLNVNSTSLTVSFNYKTSSKIAGNATRTIEIGLMDKNGAFTSLQVLTMDKNTVTTVLNHSATYTLAATGVYRLELIIGGATGDGNSRVIFDDLSVSASAYYGPTSHCNPAAVAVNNSFSVGSISPISGNVLLNDNIPSDNEVYTTSLVSAPSTGTLVLNPDGSFTYTPAAGFTGGTVSFSYQVTDNGYAPTTSNTAIVTLNFPAPVLLPLKLISFSADAQGKTVKLSWKVDENETGNYFEIEKSFDGKNYTSISKIYVQQGTGIKEYSSFDNAPISEVYYRLKIVNKDLSAVYSKVLVLKAGNTDGNVRILNNPATSTLNITYHSDKKANNTIRIYSISGIKTYEQQVLMSEGLNNLMLPVQALQPGTYVIVVDSMNTKRTAKFIKR